MRDGLGRMFLQELMAAKVFLKTKVTRRVRVIENPKYHSETAYDKPTEVVRGLPPSRIEVKTDAFSAGMETFKRAIRSVNPEPRDRILRRTRRMRVQKYQRMTPHPRLSPVKVAIALSAWYFDRIFDRRAKLKKARLLRLAAR